MCGGGGGGGLRVRVVMVGGCQLGESRDEESLSTKVGKCFKDH